jgi:hypothetical protein
MSDHPEEPRSDRDRLLDEKFRSRDKAVEVALSGMDRRLEGMNEFRAALNDLTKTLVSRTEYDTAHREIVHYVEQLRLDVTKLSAQFEEQSRVSSADRADITHRIDISTANRATLADQATTFARKAESDITHAQLGASITRLEAQFAAVTSRLDKSEGLATASTSRITTTIAVVMAVVAVLGVGFTYINSLTMQKTLAAHIDSMPPPANKNR